MAEFSNKFSVEVSARGYVRVVFNDERAKIADGIPSAITRVAELVMPLEDAVALAELILTLKRKL